MRFIGKALILWVVSVAVVALATLRAQPQASYVWNLPAGFPRPRVPADNPMTPQKVALGRYLFYDTRLSGNGRQACATCHEQARAFTDGRPRAVGSTGELHPRNAMSVVNVGRFKAPTLRNVGVTAPYMHDGSIKTLDEVLDHYAAGGRTIAKGRYRGVGHDNPVKSPIVRGFPLTAEQRADLIAFLNALTDKELLRDPWLTNPWTSQREEIRWH